MAGDYEQAFEKWLVNAQDGNKSLTPNSEESEPAPHDHLSYPGSAPFLVDDDEDHESSELEYSKNLGAGPPVLEPVSHHARNVFDAVDRDASKHSNFTSKQTDVSQSKLPTPEKPFKTYSAYGNTHKSPFKKKKFECENPVETKPNNENIFDKFCPASGLYIDDSPPPLIPSPKAVAEEQHMALEGESKKCVGKSPDFCAMEADSTSEIQTCEKGQGHSDKNSNGEISLECDSTCMLGGSPAIVSPSSNSTFGDTEETRDSNDIIKQHKNVEIQCSDGSFDEKRNAVTMLVSEQVHAWERSTENRCARSDIDQNMLCEKVDKSVGVNLTDSKPNIGFSADPPALAAICPTTSKQEKRRKQRHTVDCVEGFSKSKKNNHSNDIIYGPPPLLSPQESDNYPISSHSRPKGKKSMKCKKASNSKRPCYKRSITVPVADGLNHESTFVNALWQLSQLKTRMHTLLSQLWPQLRLGDMTPESPQFSSVVADLINMLEKPDDKMDSEENNTNLPMSHVKVSSEMQEPTKADPDFSTSLKSNQSSSQISSHEKRPCQQESLSTLKVDHCSNHMVPETSQQSTDNAPHPSSSSFSETITITSHSLMHPEVSDTPPLLDLVCSTHESSNHTVTSLHKQLQQQPPVITESSNNSTDPQNQLLCHPCNTTANSIPLSPVCASECPLSDLSKLSLADGRELCPRSVSVLLPRDPISQLADFSSLSCRALQLLLPEVPVSLTNELACSPEALMAFIDNILAMNNTTKKSHRKK